MRPKWRVWQLFHPSPLLIGRRGSAAPSDWPKVRRLARWLAGGGGRSWPLGGRGKMAAVLEVEVGGPVEREVEEVRGTGLAGAGPRGAG